MTFFSWRVIMECQLLLSLYKSSNLKCQFQSLENVPKQISILGLLKSVALFFMCWMTSKQIDWTRCSIGFRTRLRIRDTFLLIIKLYSSFCNLYLPIPVATRYKACVCSFLGFWVRISPGVGLSVSRECCVLSGRDLCDCPSTRPEESYRAWLVTLIVI
jgi:hypothetical protein